MDKYYNVCHKFWLEAEETCNIFTFSRSAVKYMSSSIKTNVWTYGRDDEGFEDGTIADFDDFDDFKARLQQDDEFEEEGEDDIGADQAEPLDRGEDAGPPPNDGEEYLWDGCEIKSEIPTKYEMGKAM